MKVKVNNAFKSNSNEDEDFELLPALNEQEMALVEPIVPKKDSQVMTIFKKIFIRNNLESN